MGYSSANSVIFILFAFSDNLSAENSKLSAESGLPGLSLLESMPQGPKDISLSPDEDSKIYQGDEEVTHCWADFRFSSRFMREGSLKHKNPY